jgi:hypothetical protein
MKYFLSLALSLLLAVTGYSQNYIQWTIKAGALPTQVDVYLRPNFDFNPGLATPFLYLGQVQFAIGWSTSCPVGPQPTVNFTIDPAFNNRSTNPADSYSSTVFPQSTSVDPAGETYNVISLNRIGSGSQAFPSGVEVKVGTITMSGSGSSCPLKIVDYLDAGNDGQASCYATNSVLGTYQRAPTSAGNFYSSPGNSLAGGDAISGYAQVVLGISLPVKLVSFTGAVSNCNATLNWITAEEINFSHFDIEGSSNGTVFTKLGVVKATGGTGQIKYSFNAGAISGNHYYRLRMVDNDGKSSYSNIALLRANCGSNEHTAVVYPNPATKGTGVNVSLQGFSGRISGVLYAADGKQVSAQSFINGSNNIATGKLAAGMYQLVISDAAGNRETRKLIITQ